MAITKDLGIATAYGYAVEKGYTGTEEEFAELMYNVAESAGTSEAWAVGSVGGVPVEEGAEQYENNAKYYAEQAGGDAENAEQSKDSAKSSAETSEAWAVGTVDGIPVTEGQTGYNNNAKYHAEQASESADAAANSEAAAKNYSDHIADPVSGIVTEWLNEHVDPESQVVIDDSLTIAGAAADAKATGDELTNVKSALESVGISASEKSDLNGDYYTPEYIEKTGYRNGTDLTTVVDVNYKVTSKIALMPGQLVTAITTTKNNYVSMLTVYDKSGTALDYIAVGGTSENTYLAAYLNKTSEVQYVSACGLAATTITIRIYNPLKADDDLLARKQSIFYAADGTTTRVRFNSDWTISNYVITPPIPLNEGDVLHAYIRCSSTIPVIIKCDAYGGNRTNAMMGNNVAQYEYVATEDCYVMVQYKQDDAFNVINVIPKSMRWNFNADNNDSRHPTVCFIYDDGSTTDSQIVDIFDAKDLRCGFALISTMAIDSRSNEYLGYQKRGYSILSHSVDEVGMNDSTVSASVIKNKLLTSKQKLMRSGFDIRGFVTPNSQMYEGFRPLLNQIYDYAYTIYYTGLNEDGKYVPGGSRPSNRFTDSPYELWRITQFSLTENLEAAIDECIENKGFLTIYFHSRDLTEAHITRLNTVLDYVKTKIANYDLKCLAPNEAFDYYFNVRHEDVIS